MGLDLCSFRGYWMALISSVEIFAASLVEIDLSSEWKSSFGDKMLTSSRPPEIHTVDKKNNTIAMMIAS